MNANFNSACLCLILAKINEMQGYNLPAAMWGLLTVFFGVLIFHDIFYKH